MKAKSSRFAVIILCFFFTVKAQTQRDLLGRFPVDEISRALLPLEQWTPFPRTAEAWRTAVADTVRQQIIHEAEQYLQIPFASLSASRMLEYQREGIRVNYEDESFKKREQLFTLIMAESMEQKGRFAVAIMDGVWSICEETYWGIPAHLYLQKAGVGLADVQDPSVDLFASETAALLALTDYLVGPALDTLSPLLRKRIYYEVDRRVLTPMEKESKDYWYMQQGTPDAPVNNWNPWVMSNWMTALLLLEKNNERRVRNLHRAMTQLDHYINWLGDDGAIDEGPSYWSGAVGRLFDALAVLESASAGRLTIYQEPVIRLAGSYIYKVHIAGNYFINTADASPTIDADGLLLYRIGKSVQDTVMHSFGAWVFHHLSGREKVPYAKDFSKPRRIWNLLAMKECSGEGGQPPMLHDVWLKSIELMAGRTSNGLFIAAHGGHNAESHNHNDVGDFIVYANGEPVIIDAGMGTYTVKTFSNERYSLWYNSSAYHNLPVINGYQQCAGSQYKAREVYYNTTKSRTTMKMDIAAAYPEEAGVQQWKRTITVNKNSNSLSVADDFVLKQPSQQLTQTFMTVCDADVRIPGKIIFNVPGVQPVLLEYDPSAWEVKRERISGAAPDEKRLMENWGHRPIWRLLLVSKVSRRSGLSRYAIRQQTKK